MKMNHISDLTNVGLKTQTIGYVRVSSAVQNMERQLYGVPVDKIFFDKLSGSTKDRPALQDLLNYVREGDTVLVHSMDRLARNTEDLLYLVNYFKRHKV